MHTLRSTYLESYFKLIKSPYTSDPFPLSSTEASGESRDRKLPSIRSLQRETEVFDLFIALKAKEDVWLDDSLLHLDKEDCFNDLFAVMQVSKGHFQSSSPTHLFLQPRRRLEDLLRHYGFRYGSVTLSETDNQYSIPFSRLSISLSPRKVS